MAILSSVLSQIGQSGQVPNFVYLQTSDTVGQVTTSGYLNSFVEQGNFISPFSMAVISTQASFSAPPVVGLYTLTQVSGNYVLTQYGSGGGAFNPATSYNNISNPSITGDWLHQGGFNVQAGSGNVVLQSNTGAVNILAPNAGQFVNITAANLSFTGSAAVNILGGSLNLNMGGNASFVSSGPMGFQGSSIAFVPASIATAVTSLVLYYNSSTGVITKGAPGAIDTSLNYVWTGSDQFNGPFGVNAPSGDVTISSAAQNINLLASTAGKSVNIQSPTVSVIASTLFNASAAIMSLSTTGTGGLSIAAGGILSLQGALGINLPTLASAAATANVVYYNSSTGYITYAAAPSGGMTWNNVVGTSQAMAVSNGYIANNAGLVTLTMPASAAVGQIVAVVGSGAGGWSISCNAGQVIHVGSVPSSSGGSVASTNQFDCVEVICVVANTSFVARNSFGNLNAT